LWAEPGRKGYQYQSFRVRERVQPGDIGRDVRLAGVDAWTVLWEVGSVDETSDIVSGRGAIVTQGPDVLVARVCVGEVGADAVGVVVETERGGRIMEGEGNDVDGLGG
jgi:hypothetical protein